MADASSIRRASSLPNPQNFYRGGIRYYNNAPYVSTGTQWDNLSAIVLHIPLQVAADDVEQNVFIADRPYQILSATEAHGVISTGAATASLMKCTGTQAPSAGTLTTSAAFDLNGVAANTVTAATVVNPTTPAVLAATIASGAVTGITIENGGAGYGSTAPTIYIQAPSATGTQATATCTLSSGVINAVTVGTAGTLYDNPPQVLALPASILNTGDRLALHFSTTPTGLVGAVITVVLQAL